MQKHFPWVVAVCLALNGEASAKESLVVDVAEFRAAVKTAQPGDAIALKNGEWRDAELIFRGEGTEKSPIELRAERPVGSC